LLLNGARAVCTAATKQRENAGAAETALQRERCCIDGRAAQKTQRVRFWRRRGVWSIGGAEQPCGDATSSSGAGECYCAEQRGRWRCRRCDSERCCIDGRAAQKMQRVRFWGRRGVWIIGDAEQPCGDATSSSGAGECYCAEQRGRWRSEAALQRKQCCCIFAISRAKVVAHPIRRQLGCLQLTRQ